MAIPPDNNSSELRQLYERFKAELVERPQEMYYDEDDLVMIFDMAGDYFDRYVQLQALIMGRRLFPDSEQLELRLGFAMLDMYDEVSMDDYLRVNEYRQGLLWDIMRLRGRRLRSDEMPACLDGLLERYRLEEDEDVIQFMNLITAYECEDWLVQNYRRLVDRCRYRDTALNECAEVLRYHSPDLALGMVEELTRLDPFNADAWIKLAEIYRSKEDVDEGLSAIEYARALRPDDYFPLYVEATLLVFRDPASQRAAELLQQVIKANPGMYEAKVALSDIYDCQGKSDLAEMIWREELRRNPDDELAKSRLAMVGGEPMSSGVASVFESDMTEEALAGRLEGLLTPEMENADGIMRLLAAYDRSHGLYQLAGEYIKLLYRHDLLDRLIEFVERQRPEGCPEMRLDPSSLPLYAASLLRLERYREAALTAREYLAKAEQFCTNPDLSMAFAGVKITLKYILARAMEERYDRDRDPVSEALAQ